MTDLAVSPQWVVAGLVLGIAVLRWVVGAAYFRLLSGNAGPGTAVRKLRNNGFVATLDGWAERRLPRAMRFLRRRLTPGAFYGLPLTAILLAVLALVLALGKLSNEVILEDTLASVDSAILDALDPLRVDPLLPAFRWITELGGNPALAATAVVGCVLLAATRRRDLLAGAAVAILGSQVTLWVGKFAFNRARPEFVWDVTAASPSFPSGHTTGAVAIYGFFAFAAGRLSGSRRVAFEVGFWAAVVIAMVGFSRVLLHVHYPTDVVAGFLVGGTWLLVAVAATWWAGCALDAGSQPLDRLDREQDPES